MKLSKLVLIAATRKRTLSRILDVGAALGAATLVGLNAFRHKRQENKRKEEERKKSLLRPGIALGLSAMAAGMALWEIKEHHHLAA
jgi:hypothetical protein